MKEFIKKNFAILAAFALPLILIFIVALSAYLPSLFISTHYNFVYSSCTDGRYYYPYNCDTYLEKHFIVSEGKLMVNPVDMTQDSDKNGVPDFNGKYSDRLFLHDTKKNESREISTEEAQALTLNGLLTSPDGVTVASHYSRGGDVFIFGGGSSSFGYYLTKGNSRSKLNLINGTDQYYYQNNFHFLGWVLPGRN